MAITRTYILSLCLLTALGTVRNSIGQSSLYLHGASAENRISENANRCMLKSSDGYIWVGTIDGLNRYDGYRFRIYHNDSRDSNSISGNYITCLYEDHQRNLWIGTNNGINRYHHARDCFVRFDAGAQAPKPLSAHYINDIIQDPRHRLWFGAYGGIGYYDYELQKFVSVPFDEKGRVDAALYHDITAFSRPHDDGFWIGYANGKISKYENDRFIHFPNLAIGSPVLDLLEDREGVLWIGADEGIFRFHPRTHQLVKVHDKKTADIYEIDQKIWINVAMDGILEWDPVSSRLQPVAVYLDNQPIYGDVKAFLRDEEGIIWASYHGLFKQDPFEKRFRHLRYERGNPNGLSESFVKGIQEDQDGNWVALTVSKGLNYFDHQNGFWSNYQNDPKFDNDILGKRASKLAVYGHHAFVIVEGLVYDMNLKDGAIRSFEYPGLGAGYGTKIIQADANRYWIGSRALLLLDTRTGKFADYTPKSAENGRSDFCLFEDECEEVWAFARNVVYQLDRRAFQFQAKYRFAEDAGNFDESVLSFCKDSRGRFWIGRRNGLEYFDPDGAVHKHYSIAHGLPNNNINSILIDHRDRLWLGTNNGLSRFDPDTESFRNYDRQDGLQDEIFLGGAVFKNPEGYLYMGGVNGFNVFHPDSVSADNPHAPRVLISDLRIFNQSVVPGPNSVLSQPIWETTDLELSYKHGSISFELLALGFSQPQKNQYAYMIEGVDRGWNFAGNRHTAFYTGLPRGEQLVFKVKAGNHDGVWGEEPVELRIFVRPPFWETAWFRIASLVLVLGLSIYYYRWRIAQVKRRTRWLESAVKQQTAEIEQQATHLKSANEELEQQAAIIKQQVRELDQLNKAQSRLFTGLSHEFRTPLTLLLGHMEELKNSHGSITFLRRTIGKMRTSALQLLQLINQLMDTAKVESGQYVLRVSEGDLLVDLQNIVSSFQVLADRKGLKLEMKANDFELQSCWFDRDILLKVLNNLLSNALKFTDRGSVQVILGSKAVTPSGIFAEIAVADSGPGISFDHQSLIFNRFYQVKHTDRVKKGTGIGLALVKQLVDLHGGEIRVESELGRGSTFRLYLPVHRDAFSIKNVIETDPMNRQSALFDMPAQPSESGRQKSQAATSGKLPILLVVEDNPEIRSFVVRQLSEAYHCLQAEDGQAGWKLALRHVPEIIVSDVVMPGMNGFQLTRKIKTDERTSHIPIILLTALADQEKKIRGLAHGADSYLSKPFSREELVLTIANLRKHRERLQKLFLREYLPLKMPDGLSAPDRSFMERLTNLVEQQISDENLGVAHLVKHMGVSRTQLFRKLKSLTGMSATEFIRDYRLRKAHQLLCRDNYNVSEVIYLTGFSSRSYFYDLFRKKYGSTPLQIRRKNATSTHETIADIMGTMEDDPEG